MSDIGKLNSPSDLSNIDLLANKKISPSRTYESKEKLEKAAKEFEGIYMDIVMKNMRETVNDSDVMGDSSKTKFFQTMLDSEYSKIISKTNHLGLAQTIVKQLTPTLQPEGSLNAVHAAAQGIKGIEKK